MVTAVKTKLKHTNRIGFPKTSKHSKSLHLTLNIVQCTFVHIYKFEAKIYECITYTEVDRDCINLLESGSRKTIWFYDCLCPDPDGIDGSL